eukprot:GFYU01004096.1.p1 GENE.GFYU01004096.1~~GFYU01004096.1.p1  ORF type:complete len:506 (-),score=133.53 GFYU01004096.1:20-1537(-)
MPPQQVDDDQLLLDSRGSIRDVSVVSESESDAARIRRNPFWFMLVPRLRHMTVTFFLVSTAYGMAYPAFPRLLINVAPGVDMKDQESHASTIAGIQSASAAAIAFLLCPVFAAFADVYGRKPLLLGSMMMTLIDLAYPALASDPQLEVLYFTRAMNAGFTMSMACVSAYATDCALFHHEGSPQENLSFVFASFGLGFAIGPITGGELVKLYGLQTVFQIATILFGCALLYMFLFMPESLPRDQMEQLQYHKLVPVKSIGILTRSRVLTLVSIVVLVFDFAIQGVIVVFQLYTAYQFDWGALENGIYLTIFGITVSFAQMFLLPRVAHIAPAKVVAICFTFQALCYVGYGVASDGWIVYALVGPRAITMIGFPMVVSILVAQVTAEEQAHLQAALANVKLVASFLAPLIMNTIFRYFTARTTEFKWAGFVFILLGVINLGCGALMYHVYRSYKGHPGVSVALSNTVIKAEAAERKAAADALAVEENVSATLGTSNLEQPLLSGGSK